MKGPRKKSIMLYSALHGGPYSLFAEIASMSELSIADQDFARAAEILADGGVVAFPTETYYGLAVDPFNTKALGRLFELKRRAANKPVLVLIDHLDRIALLAHEIPVEFRPLIARFWPGPLTLLFRSLDGLPPLLTGDTGTVGVRISSHPAANRLAMVHGRPISATSANISGATAAVTAAEVREQFGDRIDLILDGGRTPGGPGSTVAGLNNGKLRVFRAGVISLARINKVFTDC